MKAGYLTTTNAKGHQDSKGTAEDKTGDYSRDCLNIVPSSEGLYLYPVWQMKLPQPK